MPGFAGPMTFADVDGSYPQNVLNKQLEYYLYQIKLQAVKAHKHSSNNNV